MLGVDEHLWRQTRRGGKYVTVIIDLTGIREGTGPARLLDMVSGRSKQAVKQCLAGRDESWREAWRGRRDGRPSPGSRPPPPRSLPDAVAAGDPFHVVRLTGAALDRCRRRVLQDTRGHRGRKGDPWDAARRTLHTGAGLLTDKQRQRLAALFAGEEPEKAVRRACISREDAESAALFMGTSTNPRHAEPSGQRSPAGPPDERPAAQFVTQPATPDRSPQKDPASGTA